MTVAAPDLPRLSSLAADAVAMDGARRCFARAKRLCAQLGPIAELELGGREEELMSTPVFRHLHRLHAWAQGGVGEAEAVERALREVLVAMLTRASAPEDGPSPEAFLTEVSERDPIGVVCLAAWARLEVVRGHRIDGRCLAALAGLSQTHIRTISRAKGLKPATTPTSQVGTLYDAREVHRFLAARGVAGFVE